VSCGDWRFALGLLRRLAGLARNLRFATAVQPLAYILRIAGCEYKIKQTTCGPKTARHALRGVMVQVVLFHVTKVRIAEIRIMRGVVDPLLRDVRLKRAGYDQRSGKRRKEQETQRSTHQQQWQ